MCPSSPPTKECLLPPWKGWGIRRRRVYDLDANQELIALGVSNFLAGLFGDFAGGGSLSKTTVNDVAGARTQVSDIVSIVLVLVILFALTPLYYYLPEATLGAIVIHAVWGLLDVGEMRCYFSLRRTDFVPALVALLVFDILPGLLLAVVFSLESKRERGGKPVPASLSWWR